MNVLAFLLILALIACVTGFAVIVLVDRYNRAHPDINSQFPLPQTADQMKTPPELIPLDHDVKG